MQADLDKVLAHLRTAAVNIEEPYFYLPIAGGDHRDRERVYCYELYHQWRSLWSHAEWSLCGETDKRSHPCFTNAPVKNTKPDFLVHRAGEMSSQANLLVVEVKHGAHKKKRQIKRMVEDLEKLTAYRSQLTDEHDTPANYFGAIFWIYGLTPEIWYGNLRTEILQWHPRHFNTELIRCFIHPSAKSEPVEVYW